LVLAWLAGVEAVLAAAGRALVLAWLAGVEVELAAAGRALVVTWLAGVEVELAAAGRALVVAWLAGVEVELAAAGRALVLAWLAGVEVELAAAGRALVLAWLEGGAAGLAAEGLAEELVRLDGAEAGEDVAGWTAALAGAGWLAPGLGLLEAAGAWVAVDLAGVEEGITFLAGATLLAGFREASWAGSLGGVGGGVVALTAPVDSRARKVVMNRLWKLRRLCGPIAKDSSNVWKRECGADKLSAPHLEWRHQCLGSQKILNMNNNCFVQDPAT